LIARCKGFQKFAEFFAVNLRARNLLTIDARTPRRLELVELRFKGLPYGRDAGVTKAKAYPSPSGRINILYVMGFAARPIARSARKAA
jgi:hypothetical protein